jgi:hypothetical protein
MNQNFPEHARDKLQMIYRNQSRQCLYRLAIVDGR